MPKVSTSDLQSYLAETGEALGFKSTVETTLLDVDDYSPRHDVVWRLPLGRLLPRSLAQRLLDSPKHPWLDLLGNLPIAAFETEGATTSSKNQLGNFANLYSSPALFGFAVVDNAGAGKENDTYRRGVRIARSFRQMLGTKPVFFLDRKQLLGADLPDRRVSKAVVPDAEAGCAPIRKGAGGETTSADIASRLFKVLAGSSLRIDRDYQPPQMEWAYSVVRKLKDILPRQKGTDYLLGRRATWDPVLGMTDVIKKAGDYFYIPKIDIMLSFPLPPAFTAWLRNLGHAIGQDSWNYPLLFHLVENPSLELRCPLVAIEIETGASKHANGGIINMAHNAFMGLLFGHIGAEPHLDMLKRELGLGNVFFRDADRAF
jgi:hypothetical protein